MKHYQSNILKSALRLPAINWNLTFFGGHSQHVKAGWHIGLEKHLAFEMIQIISGSEKVFLSKSSFLLSDGDILIIPPNLEHSITCLKDMEYFNFHFDLDSQFFTVQLIKHGLIYYPHSTFQNEELTASLSPLHNLIREDMNYPFETKLQIQKYFANFLLVLNKQTKDNHSVTNLTKLHYAGAIAGNLQKLLHDQTYKTITAKNNSVPIDDQLTISKAISSVQISPSYGFEVFKAIYGLSPRAYLSKLKLEEAKRLLLIPNYSISTISTALGYSEQSHFARQFKRWTNMTPNQFRNQSN